MSSQHPFDMPKPCNNCPFRREGGIKIAHAPRAQEICDQDGTFSCHKTVDYSDEEGEGRQVESSKVCAGSLIYQIKTGQPNQMTRIGQRLGLFDPDSLDRDSFDDVINNPDEMME